MSARHEKMTKDLRKAEQEYKHREDELRQLVEEYSELTHKGKADLSDSAHGKAVDLAKSAPNLKVEALVQTHSESEAVRDKGTDRADHIQTKTYEEKAKLKTLAMQQESVVALECRCKLAQYKLNNQSNVVKDAFLQFTESIKEMERYKHVVITQLKDIVVKKAPIFVSTASEMREHAKSVE